MDLSTSPLGLYFKEELPVSAPITQVIVNQTERRKLKGDDFNPIVIKTTTRTKTNLGES